MDGYAPYQELANDTLQFAHKSGQNGAKTRIDEKLIGAFFAAEGIVKSSRPAIRARRKYRDDDCEHAEGHVARTTCYEGTIVDESCTTHTLHDDRRAKLRKRVASKLILDWSPQVSGWLKIHYPADESMRVSHETIYRSLFIQARGVLKKELLGHLRSKRRIRRSQQSRVFKDARGQIVDAISIRERSAEIEVRAVPGHWEGDLMGGTKNSHIATLVERHSRFTAVVKVRSKGTTAVVAALSRQIRRLPTTLRRSLTWDRGLEMAKH